jgi:hypothetical protein
MVDSIVDWSSVIHFVLHRDANGCKGFPMLVKTISHACENHAETAVVEVLKHRYHIAELDIKGFNYAMSRDAEYGPNIDLKVANETGVFRNTRRVRTNSGTELGRKFYYILSEAESKRVKVEDRVPKYPNETRYWQEYYDNNRIRISPRKRDWR